MSLEIPKNKFVVITGPSGSGKSSLAFDTLFAEAQRRYLESLSAYARQFVDQLKKPHVDVIRGLCPAIAIQQKAISKSPRSTAGTLTEVYDFMRLLFSRVGDPQCPKCSVKLSSASIDDITRQIMSFKIDSKINILSVVARNRKGEFVEEFNELLLAGISKARIDGQEIDIEKGLRLEKLKPHTIEAYIDRLVVKESSALRIREAVEVGCGLLQGLVSVENLNTGESHLFSKQLSCPTCGSAFPELSPRLFSFNSPLGACTKCKGLGVIGEEEDLTTCPSCDGLRLKPAPLNVFIEGFHIMALSQLAITESLDFFKNLKFAGNKAIIAEKILKEITDRLGFLNQVGLGYLSLSRQASSLSGGEEQRLHLATQIGTKLTGVLYILDEPSIGLHQSDNVRLLEALRSLCHMGNTVIVVEHDEDTIRSSDFVIDLGPGAGRLGGQLVEASTPQLLKKGITSKYLSGALEIKPPQKTRSSTKQITLHEAFANNLKGEDIAFPLGTFICVTGVSGSGKSSLVLDCLLQTLSLGKPVGCKSISGEGEIDKVIAVDQSPIGRTPRSNPATYVGLFDLIRELFSQTAAARVRGYKSSRFSFNLKGGRCETCGGAGIIQLEMHFLPDVTVPCEECGGKRYNEETLHILFKERSIFDVLEMTFDEAFEFFDKVPAIQQKIKSLIDVGLGYLKLGQSAVTLSGGEAQRLKLSKELSKRATGRTLYIFDEPTTGLHFVDVDKLVHVIQQLVDMGNTVVVVEHNLDVIKCADYVIDLGPEGGKRGGKIIASGSPEAITKFKISKTGCYLKKLFERNSSCKNKYENQSVNS